MNTRCGDNNNDDDDEESRKAKESEKTTQAAGGVLTTVGINGIRRRSSTSTKRAVEKGYSRHVFFLSRQRCLAFGALRSLLSPYERQHLGALVEDCGIGSAGFDVNTGIGSLG